jgi:hypothetical protein
MVFRIEDAQAGGGPTNVGRFVRALPVFPPGLRLHGSLTTPLPELSATHRKKQMVRKVVLSDNLIGALVDVEEFDHCTSRRVTISTRGQPGDTARRFTTEWQKPADCFILDIALFKGKLYILTTQVQHYQRDLHVLDDGGQGHTGHSHTQRPKSAQYIHGARVQSLLD